jgi:hypothetical protein
MRGDAPTLCQWLLAGSLVLVACRAEEMASPHAARPDARPPANVVDVPAAQVVEVPATWSTVPVWVNPGIRVAPGFGAWLRITGEVTATPPPECTTGTPITFGFMGSPGGAYGKVGFIAVDPTYAGPESSSEFTPIDGYGSSARTGLALVDHYFTADSQLVFRRAAISPSCAGPWGTAPYTVTGGNSVFIEFFSVDIAATQTSVTEGQAITFTANVVGYTPTAGDQIGWRFVATGQNVLFATEIEACRGHDSCDFAPTTSGRMYAQVSTLYGTAIGQFVEIAVTNACPTGIALLDAPPVRALMRLAWDSSNADDPDKMKRRERTGVIFDSAGQLVARPYFNDAKDLPCISTASPVGTLPGTPIAVFHTHPWSHGEETIGICAARPTGLNANATVRYDAKSFGGPSEGDFERLVNDRFYNDSIQTMVVLDKDNIYTVPAGTTKNNWKNNVKKYPRRPSGCTRP